MNKKQGFSSILGIIIVLIIVAGGIYWFSQDQSATPAPADSVTLDTSEWQTYRNEEYGFEFEYPQTYTVKVEDNNKNTIVFETDQLTFGVFVVEEQDRSAVANEYNLRFSGNAELYKQILSTFKFTK